MYFSEFIKILKDNEYINDELHQKLSHWDRKDSFHYTNIRENVRNRIDLNCNIFKINDWSDLHHFSLEITYQIYPKNPQNKDWDYISISVPHHILIVGQIEFNKINNIKIKEYYDKINLRNLFKEIDEMSDFEREMEEKKYNNWNEEV
jgi:hypothetical protein